MDREGMNKGQEQIDPKWLVLYLLDELSQEGRVQVESWLDRSEENRREFRELQKTWETTGTVDPLWARFDESKAWEKVARRIREREEQAKPITGRTVRMLPKPVRWMIGAAAVLIVGALSFVGLRLLLQRPEPETHILAATTEVVQDTLSDGSAIVLNSRSELVAPRKFGEQDRTVRLTGEAFFDVQPDAGRPFRVETQLAQVTVLGTSFQVKAYPESDLEVFVESGQVELYLPDSLFRDSTRLLLKAGERAVVDWATRGVRRIGDMVPDGLFWANKKLIFLETKLSLVFDLLRKYYEAQIVVQDTTILDRMLSATFTDEKIEGILEVVAASFNLMVSRDKDTFIIKRKETDHGRQ